MAGDPLPIVIPAPEPEPRGGGHGFPPRIGVRGRLCAGNTMALRRPHEGMKMAAGTFIHVSFRA